MSQLSQFVVRCGTEEDKFLLLYALLKLRLLRGRALLFVATLARGYRLKLFLDQFGIPACALNAQLPARSRCHVIAQFNRGIYDYIVATDEEAPALPAGHPPGKRRRGTGQRCHVIAQFNRGIYDYIVATDEEAPALPAGHPPGKRGRGTGQR
ncbi:PREDICTED: probable ATP-dependent RNA helicase DDX56 [Calidris pugnax]|uniref:probable ATP-dependent RNA helicase DDX56 n=1 Tax=Calidris pugnax TaxID=198806 RepID=UPI00071E6464|nr:PREDICTED: probable ATP-dependent RNA helicase DDX56 [Calidris pugnax]